MKVKPFPRPQWSPKPNDNAVNIDVRVLLQDRRLMVAELRFAPHAIFDAHDAPWDCHVLCLQGSGFVLVGDDSGPISAGESILWPAKVMHQLWTEDDTMVTQMIEHVHQVEDPAKAWQVHQQQKR